MTFHVLLITSTTSIGKEIIVLKTQILTFNHFNDDSIWYLKYHDFLAYKMHREKDYAGKG
jgi:hypothetical protein